METKTLVINNRVITLTPLAKKLLAGQISEADIFLETFRNYEENGEKPFCILANAFLDSKKPLSFHDIYFGIMQGFRPGDDLEVSLEEAKLITSPMPETPKRRLKFLLELLELMGAIKEFRELWTSRDAILLQKIAYQPLIATENQIFEISQLPEKANDAMIMAHLHYTLELVRRYCAALLAKRFVIFTGLSGSGKTKLAQAFANWLAFSKNQIAIVPVGANWTSNEHILGYADALDPAKYVRTQALDLILQAEQNPSSPFFLILDEMNLSHVERYFADMLSAIESGEKIRLYSEENKRDGVPSNITLPPNLFIIGTVNVDETTYMFSPKVLDRANTIEFRVESQEMQRFLSDPQTINLEVLSGLGLPLAEAFTAKVQTSITFNDEDKKKLERELMLFFNVLKHCGAEFGFRTVNEITRFIFFHKMLTSSEWHFKVAMDAQVFQKMLPKLQGSRKKLEPILWALATLCYQEHSFNDKGEPLMNDGNNLQDEVNKALQLKTERDPFRKDARGDYVFPEENAYYPLSYKKIIRMLQSLAQGFTSFTEA